MSKFCPQQKQGAAKFAHCILKLRQFVRRLTNFGGRKFAHFICKPSSYEYFSYQKSIGAKAAANLLTLLANYGAKQGSLPEVALLQGPNLLIYIRKLL
uniref:Uncharacterized protein n=1 Tax=Tupiella akineta TaxID=160070 RepID=Q6UVP7_TUPAK|nr:hypothetical protein PsakpMp64 [Tupiella akineta]AAQ18777.1 hypothetical protein [Tupiella akineta]